MCPCRVANLIVRLQVRWSRSLTRGYTRISHVIFESLLNR